ncbi:hypothetical protein [Leifsonia virtsii]|uniref:Integral membrane protein n=1 Tax=Leifsonia virtsii TaxID=3035915 RepID=A0ABT8J1W5_9MICO|nr:hypothetical protein [Leifsonia virtsii]MDN4599070.1 hypothetical protein [Leifsonia virtsii]
MTTTTPDTRPATIASALRALYFVRFGFAIVWAILIALTAASVTPLTASLLVLYPLFDVVAAVIDHRASRGTRSAGLLYVNMALSVLAAVGLVFAAGSGRSAVLLVWGLWAITAGVVQLIVGISRRSLGGQWPMILSGGISVFAGAGFALQSAGAGASLVSLAGYATLGGIFFLVSAIRLSRASKAEAR